MEDLFRGLEQTDYQDILRAIGLYIDERRLRRVRIIELDDCLLLQGVTMLPTGERVPHEVRFRVDHLRAILDDAYARRQPRPPRA